jgi:type I restriction enzyme S subunit
MTNQIKTGYKQTEIGVIPEDWEVGKLENFFSFISYGFTNPMPTVENGVYMITAADINNGKIQYDSARCTTETAYQLFLSPKSKPKKMTCYLQKMVR